MKIPSLTLLGQAFTAVLRRFPAAMLATVVGMIAVMIILENDRNPETMKLWMMAQLGLPLFVGLTALAESRGWTRLDWRTWAIMGGGLLLLVIYFFTLPEPRTPSFETHGLRYVVLLAVAHLFVAVAPYLNSGAVDDFWEYNKQLFANFIVGGAYTFILWGGLALAILAVDQLFDLNIRGEAYGHLFIVLAGLFNTVFFLYHFPADYRFDTADTAYNAVFKNLCKYILIPIVILYFLILYAYSAKILITWTLPKGWIGALVLGFSVAGIFTYLLNYLLPRYDPGLLISRYRRWFWWVMIPLVALLFVAIRQRIGDYGVTEPRYFVAAAGLWLLTCCLYFTLSRTDNIKFIPISLGLFLLATVFGPWSAFAVSRRSQLHVLENLLIENGLLVDGRIPKASKTTVDSTSRRINSVLYYLDQRGALARGVEPWLGMPLASLPVQPRYQDDQAARLGAWLGLRNTDEAFDGGTLISVVPNLPVKNGNMRGYTTWYHLDEYSDRTPPIAGRYFALTADGSGLAWREKRGGRTEDLDVYDLRPQLKAWLGQAGTETYLALPVGGETIDFNGRRAEVRLVLEEVRFVEKEDGQVALKNFRGLVFLKDKVK